MNKFNIDLGNKITALREAAGQTQSEIAELLGYKSHQQVSYLENGQRSLNIQQIAILAKHFNVSADYLLGLTDASTTLNTAEQQALRTACDYTGLSEKIVTLLNDKFEERKAMRDFSNIVSERLEDKTKPLFPAYPLIDKRLCDIIALYFEKLQAIIRSYKDNSEDLKKGIDDYNKYIEIRKNEFQKFAAIVIESDGKNEEATEIFERINGDIADDILENREMNLNSPLNAANSALFQLQDAVISYAKSLCDITESSQQAYKLIYDRSVFLDFDKIYRTVHKDEEGSIIDEIDTLEDMEGDKNDENTRRNDT